MVTITIRLEWLFMGICISQLSNSQFSTLLDVVRGKSFFCQTLVLCAFSAVVGVGPDWDAASWGEYSCHLNILRVHKADKVLHDDVDAVLMEVTVIAEAEKIKLKTLALHHLHVGNVWYANLGEVGLACDGAEWCKLRAVESYPIVVAGMFVYESLWKNDRQDNAAVIKSYQQRKTGQPQWTQSIWSIPSPAG